MERLNKVIAVIGGRGKGKTTFTKNIIKKHNKKVLIIDTIDHPAYADVAIIKPDDLKGWRSGTRRIVGAPTKHLYTCMNTFLRNCLVVFEDATKYIDSSVPEHIMHFIIDSKQKNLDLIFIYHDFASVPPKVYRLLDEIELFKTNEDYLYPNLRNKIPQFQVVSKVFEKVKNHKNNFYHERIIIN